MHSLLSKIDDVIQDMSDGCPSLVFCATRKDCERVAAHLAGLTDGNDHKNNYVKSSSHRLELQRASDSIRNNEILKQCLRRGVCFHSAALSINNRRIVESVFRTGKLAVCCTTTTLAQGVNLPARLVVVMSTLQWRGPKRGYVEYDRSTVLQMIGRAGRPQYVVSFTITRMIPKQTKNTHTQVRHGCQSSDYDTKLDSKSLRHGTSKRLSRGEQLEKSSRGLYEYRNRVRNRELEIQCDRMDRANVFLHSSRKKSSTVHFFFFFPERRVRIRQYAHPTLQNRYNISGESEDDLKRFVSAHVDTIFKRLTISGMCLTDDDQKKQQWISTDTGRLMCRYFLRFETVQQFASFDRDPSKIVKGLKTHSSSDEDDMFRVLLLLSKCYELIEIGIRREEKKALRNFQGRFDIPHKKGAMDASKKCFQVLQARCAESTGRSISIKALQIQQMQILENANRVRIVRARE